MAGENFATKKGYEFYAEHARAFRDNTREKTEQILELIPWGTPDEYLDKLKKVDALIDLGALLTHFNYAGMPYDVAEENMRLFAREVLPELKKWDKGPFAEAKVTTAE
jgi:hypothetical protein